MELFELFGFFFGGGRIFMFNFGFFDFFFGDLKFWFYFWGFWIFFGFIFENVVPLRVILYFLKCFVKYFKN